MNFRLVWCLCDFRCCRGWNGFACLWFYCVGVGKNGVGKIWFVRKYSFHLTRLCLCLSLKTCLSSLYFFFNEMVVIHDHCEIDREQNVAFAACVELFWHGHVGHVVWVDW